jgi:hypothetical protein
MRKNQPPPEPIHRRGKLEELKGKQLVVLVKPESHRRSPTPLVEFLRRKSPPLALHAARRRLKVSETESPSHCDTVGTNRVGFGEP